MNPIQQAEITKNEKERNTRKLNLIDNLGDLGLTNKQQKRFIKFYYSNLDMNLLEALDEFKKK